jgi:hypothetical protein
MARSGSPPLEDQRAHVFKNDSGIALPSRLGRVLVARKVPVGLDVRIEGLARTAGPSGHCHSEIFMGVWR